MLRAWCRTESLAPWPGCKLHRPCGQVPSLLQRQRPHFSTSRYLLDNAKDTDDAGDTETNIRHEKQSQKKRRMSKSRKARWQRLQQQAFVESLSSPVLDRPGLTHEMLGESDEAEGRIHAAEKSGKPSTGWMSLQDRLQLSSNVKSKEGKAPPRPTADKQGDTSVEISGKELKAVKRVIKSKGKAKTSTDNAAIEVKTMYPRKLHLQPIDDDLPSDIPKLSYGLDRVLFNPGVYHMQDGRSGVYNFDPYLASIMPANEFDYEALGQYITSSKDSKLRELAAKHDKKYCGSTSSMTAMLSHLHFLLSSWRKPNLANLSKSFHPDSLNFTVLTRGPVATFAAYKDGVYAIDADKQYDRENILSMLGKSMEKLLTLPKDDFEKFRLSKSHELTEEQRNSEESYHYTTLGDFMMRSQLDAHDPRLPGSGVFDLKTRAVVTIRMDVKDYEKGKDYEIRRRFGQWESFEREYYDLIRAAFLKYSLQVRMGRMDGIFVAYHNTQRIFGFQYISLAEMDQAIHGTTDLRVGDQEFKASLTLLNELLNKASERFPGKSLRLHLETRPTKVPLTYFFAEPVTDEEMQTIQEASKPAVEQVAEGIRDLSEKERDAEAEAQEEAVSVDGETGLQDDNAANDAQNDSAWREMMSKVEETVESDALGVKSVREALQDALEQSGLLNGKTEVEVEQYLDGLVSALSARSNDTQDLDRSHESAMEAADASSSDPATQSANADKSLKELILKVAEGIDKKEAHLETFQRIFAGQAAGPDADSEAGTSSTRAGESGGVDAELEASSEESEQIEAEEASDDQTPTTSGREILGMYVTIRNQVNGRHVERPDDIEHDFNWNIQYAITELPERRARRIYAAIKKRRKATLTDDPYRSKEWYKMFRGNLPIKTKQGRDYRAARRREEEGKSVYVAWDEKPLDPAEGV